MGKPKEHLDLRFHEEWKEVPGWQECHYCHQLKQGCLRHKNHPEPTCRECLKKHDLYDRCRFGNSDETGRKTNVQSRRCFRKARAKVKEGGL